MKINSKNLWQYIDKLDIGEKVKFNVYYDDYRITTILWNGESFEWESGCFTSGAFFNSLYDFEVIEDPKNIEKVIFNNDGDIVYYENGEKHRFTTNKQTRYLAHKMNEIIDYINNERE